MADQTYTPDNLFGGSALAPVSVPITVAEGEDLVRGAVLGRVLRELGDAEADAGNAGEGTIEDVALGAGSEVGTYQIECIDANIPAVFSVLTPGGVRLKDAVAGVPYVGPIAFTIEAYGAAFDEGDRFTVEVEEGSKECVLAESAGTDGRERLFGLLADAVDASDESAVGVAYIGGEFNKAALTVAETDTADTWEDQGRELGIILRTTIPA